MEVSSTQLQNVPGLRVEGEIDHGTAPRLESAIEQELKDGSRFLLLDLAGVEYIDSGGISVLLTTLRRLRNSGWLGVIEPTPSVHRLLDMVGLTIDRGFRVFASADEARQTILGLAAPAEPVDVLHLDGVTPDAADGMDHGATAGPSGTPS